MFRGGFKLTPAEEKALHSEAERIAGMGASWVPTKEALLEVMLTIKTAGFEEHRITQRKGIKSAQEKGIRTGRPRMEPPDHFDDIVEALECGEISKASAARSLGVSQSTLYRWLKEQKEAMRHSPSDND